MNCSRRGFVSIKFKLTNFMISIRISYALIGIAMLNRAVSIIICMLLIVPQRIWSKEEKINERAMFEKAKLIKRYFEISMALSIAFLVAGEVSLLSLTSCKKLDYSRSI